MATLYGKTLLCPLQKSLWFLFKDHGDSLRLFGGGEKKVKAELLFCVYNKSITTATTVMSQTLHQGPDSVSEGGRAA